MSDKLDMPLLSLDLLRSPPFSGSRFVLIRQSTPTAGTVTVIK
jgi:hypothetical protein